jgi:predicted GNAT superfamily acetyltransferase
MVRDATDADTATILALNEESVHFLSPMDAARFALLRSMAGYLRVIEVEGAVAGFLLAFADGARYDSPNFGWFSRKYDRFLYIDRVAITKDGRGQGLGKQLYEDLFAYARDHGIPRITAEFYLNNDVSARFHASFGFGAVGEQMAYGKPVSLVVATL